MAEMDETRLLVKMARMYYRQEMTQAQIASRVALSRQKVQRLLRKCRETGVVDILIRPTMGAFSDLERELEDRYELKDAVVTETESYDNQAVVRRDVAAAAAEYLCRVFRSKDKVVVSWGSNVKQTLDALYHHPRPNVTGVEVIQGFGGTGDTEDQLHVTLLTQRLAAWFGVPGLTMPAPMLAGSAQARRAFCSDPSVSKPLDAARNADLFITGIGTPASAIRTLKGFGAGHPELSGMPVAGAAGDISLRFFDSQGRPMQCDFDERIIGLSLKDLKKIGMVVAVAGGAEKFKPVLAAMKGRLVNILVTDHVTARRLLEAREARQA
jgi:DNA-binding transcriptional regulator LsrR (DeoR family)